MTDNNGLVQSGDIISADNLPEPIYNDNGKVIDAWFIDEYGIPQHVVAQPGQYICKNGSIKDAATGYFVTQGIVGKITPQNAHDKLDKLRQKKISAAIRAIADASSDKTVACGLREIYAAQVELAKEKNAYSTRAAEFVMRSLELDEKSPTGSGLTVHLDHNTAIELLTELRARRKPDDDDV